MDKICSDVFGLFPVFVRIFMSHFLAALLKTQAGRQKRRLEVKLQTVNVQNPLY